MLQINIILKINKRIVYRVCKSWTEPENKRAALPRMWIINRKWKEFCLLAQHLNLCIHFTESLHVCAMYANIPQNGLVGERNITNWHFVNYVFWAAKKWVNVERVACLHDCFRIVVCRNKLNTFEQLFMNFGENWILRLLKILSDN